MLSQYSIEGMRRLARRIPAPVGRLVAVTSLVMTLGCYTMAPTASAPAPGGQFGLMLTDRGRADLADRIGPGVVSIEGTLVENTGTTYVVSVARTRTLSGVSHWGGERVTVNHDAVANVLERRYSKGRTAVAIAAAIVGATVFILTRDLLGFGSEGSGNLGNGPGNET